MNKLLTTIGDLTSSELKSKDNIIHKLINQNNCEENQQNLDKSKFNQNYIRRRPEYDSDKNNSINAIKEQGATIKENSTSVKSNNQRSEKSKIQVSKAEPEKKVTYQNHRRLYVKRYSRERYEQG